jgi:catechol 2,3-dioxygenase-like lactoylglutathione lyase family enzyme
MYRLFIILATSACALFGQLPAPNQSGISLGHLHLMVADPEAQKKIWVAALGAEVTHTGTLELLRLPGVYIIVGKARTPPAEGTDGSTVNHIGFAVKDLAAVKAKLEALHIESAPVNGNAKQIMAKFPEKVTVELTEDPALATAVAMHHIHMATPDPEKLRAWYVKTFGARAGMRGNFVAAFIPGGEVDMRKAQDPQAPTKGRSLDHIGFEVRDLEAFCKRLSADGVQFESPYRDVPAIGLKIAFLIDPEGTRIELTEGLAGK